MLPYKRSDQQDHNYKMYYRRTIRKYGRRTQPRRPVTRRFPYRR